MCAKAHHTLTRCSTFKFDAKVQEAVAGGFEEGQQGQQQASERQGAGALPEESFDKKVEQSIQASEPQLMRNVQELEKMDLGRA